VDVKPSSIWSNPSKHPVWCKAHWYIFIVILGKENSLAASTQLTICTHKPELFCVTPSAASVT